MFDIVFYKNRSGKEPVLEYIEELSECTDKDSRVKLQKVHDYINYLRTEICTASPFCEEDAEDPVICTWL